MRAARDQLAPAVPMWNERRTANGVLIFGRVHFRDRNVPLPESQ